jgi:protein phosphatase
MVSPSEDTLVITQPFQASELPAPFSSLVEVEQAALSDAGRVRDQNEDAYLLFKTGRSWECGPTSLPTGHVPKRFDECGYVMAVADGMGGHKAGEVASHMALRTAVAIILNTPHWALKLDNPQNRVAEVGLAMERATGYFKAINRAIFERAQGDHALAAMGTTLTATYTFANDLFVMHVGDSRVYLWRQGELRQLTRDHTIAQEKADRGELTPEEVQHHRLSHVLTRAMGGGMEDIEPEVCYHEMFDGDVLLLCTDGLTNMVSDRGIAGVLERNLSAAETCQELVHRALGAGGRDNVTVVVGKYRIPPRNTSSTGREAEKPPLPPPLLPFTSPRNP